MSRRKPLSSAADATPTVESIADSLKAAIAALAPGDRIGAERELAEQYGVTRWVLRKVLAGLEGEGLITQVSGRNGGIFVAHQKVIRDLAALQSINQYLRAQGLEAGTTVLGTQVMAADDTVAAALELEPGTWVFQIDRLRLAARLPLSIESAWLPADMFPGLLNHSLIGSVYELLESEYGIERGEAVEHIGAVAADRQQAASLHVPIGTPLVSVTRTARLTSGQLFDYGRELYRADRVKIVAHTSGRQINTRQILS